MLQQDYLMRLIATLIQGMQRNLFGQTKSYKRSAEDLEETLSDALDLDMETLLTLSPESFSTVMEVSGIDPQVVEYVARTLALEASLLKQAGNEDVSELRMQQARALMEAYELEPFDPSYCPTEQELEDLALSISQE